MGLIARWAAASVANVQQAITIIATVMNLILSPIEVPTALRLRHWIAQLSTLPRYITVVAAGVLVGDCVYGRGAICHSTMRRVRTSGAVTSIRRGECVDGGYRVDRRVL